MMKDSKYEILKYLAELSENRHPTKESFENKGFDTTKLDLLVDDQLVRRSAGTYYLTDKGRVVYREERIPRLLDGMTDVVEDQKGILKDSADVNQKMKLYTVILILISGLTLISSAVLVLARLGFI